MEHTKGTWSYLRSKKKHKESLFIITDAHKGENMFIGKVYGFGVHDEIANASLIAAAPNLLAVCKELVKGFDSGMDCTDILDLIGNKDSDIGQAIAKAEGRL